MANIALAVQPIPALTGVTPTYTGSLSTSNTYQVINDGKTIFHMKKANAVACNVTFKTPATINGLAVAEDVRVLPASGGDKLYSGFDPSIYNVPGTSYMEFTLSDVDGVTVACFQQA